MTSKVRRRSGIARCALCHKLSYKTKAKATKALRKSGSRCRSIYQCRDGYWHLTTYKKSRLLSSSTNEDKLKRLLEVPKSR
jgi:hypothetical protein